jgi:hypothetical protein
MHYTHRMLIFWISTIALHIFTPKPSFGCETPGAAIVIHHIMRQAPGPIRRMLALELRTILLEAQPVNQSGPVNSQILAGLLEMMRDSDEIVGAAAIDTIGRLGPSASSARPTLEAIQKEKAAAHLEAGFRSGPTISQLIQWSLTRVADSHIASDTSPFHDVGIKYSKATLVALVQLLQERRTQSTNVDNCDEIAVRFLLGALNAIVTVYREESKTALLELLEKLIELRVVGLRPDSVNNALVDLLRKNISSKVRRDRILAVRSLGHLGTVARAALADISDALRSMDRLVDSSGDMEFKQSLLWAISQLSIEGP